MIKLDDTQVYANLAVARGRTIDAMMQRLRLEAERDGKSTFEMPAELIAQGDPMASRMFEAQQALFEHGTPAAAAKKVCCASAKSNWRKT